MTKQKQWEELELKDDFMFAKVMQNPELCKGTLERLLEIKINRIEYPELQKPISLTADGKSVRLDVYVRDDKNTVYNVEIQTTDTKELPKRSRYYQGMIDLNLIEKGERYRKLNPSFVIFICTFDVFGKGMYRYTFRNVCVEDSEIKLGDGAVKVFYNAGGITGDIGPEACSFLKYVAGKGPQDMFTEHLEREVKRVKENKEWRREYMMLLMRDQENIEKGREEGIIIGIAEGKIEGIVKMCREFQATQEVAARKLQKEFGMELEEAMTHVKAYWDK
ncbi:MAG: Rpn family recombination-promoting nuclease/putative transposase [Eubacteriales bacterium]|nr:Rpn family recombination-promoting nuclease/putative transposase [Eubacteriales bacterium]